MWCAVHRQAFTLYPPGHVPYGRSALVEMGADGCALTGEGGAPSPCLAAAQDAAEGARWPRDDAPSDVPGVRSTQRRQVERAAAMLGVIGEEGPGPEAVACATGLPEGWLVEVAAKLATERDLSVWGRQVAGVAAALGERCRRPRLLMDLLAVLGHLAGLWGRPYRWLPRARRLHDLMRRLDVPSAGGAGTDGRKPTIGGRSSLYDLGPREPP